MTAVVFLPIVVTIVLLLVFAYLVGVGELDDVLLRWEQDRRTRESLRAEAAKREALRGPRVLP